MDFYFPYAGSKRNEIINIINIIDLNKYDNIIEPFGGSVAFSRYLYNNIDKNKKYIICDINTDVVFFCNNFYKNKLYVIEQCKNKVNECNDKNIYDDYLKNIKNINDNDFLIYFLFKKKNYNIREGLYPDKRKTKFIKYDEKTKLCDEFFKNIHYDLQDYKITMEKYKNDSKSFLFIDPPYLNSCNDFYQNQNIKKSDISDMFETMWKYLFDYFNDCQCKFIMIVNNNFFIKMCFNKWFYKEYSKKYEGSKKVLMHCIFTNIKY